MTMAYDLALLLTTKESLSKAGVFKESTNTLHFSLFFGFVAFFFSFLLEIQIGYLGYGNSSRSKIFQPRSMIIAVLEMAHSHSLLIAQKKKHLLLEASYLVRGYHSHLPSFVRSAK